MLGEQKVMVERLIDRVRHLESEVAELRSTVRTLKDRRAPTAPAALPSEVEPPSTSTARASAPPPTTPDFTSSLAELRSQRR
jgi:phage shock protein A